MSFAEPTTLGIGIAAAGAIAFGVWYFRRRKKQRDRQLRAQENI
jgi:LPXTG-motif cell wall-anchored protein